ncbi:MAG: hypothetical protein LIP28_09130 [Deltaproteobacteria bacterium]|nr:hypothetical protein [Deltaproteobacteria bacterium]
MALILLGAYALLIAWTAFSGKKQSADAFYVNERASGALGVGFSILVSCVGASATIGMIGMAFVVGTPAFWWLGAGAVGLAALSLFLARKVRKSEAYTLPHMAETFLGKQTRPLMAAIIVAAWSAILAAQFSALIAVLGPLTGFGSQACLAIGFLLVCGHTLGGQSAIMRVDRLQALVILTALGMTLVWLSLHNPGWTGAFRLEIVNAAFPLEKLRYDPLAGGANYLVCPMLFGRFFSARDEKSAVAGGLLGASGIAVCSVLIVAVGLACRGLLPEDTAPDAVLTRILAEVMPSWMHLVVSLALVSAIVSSADSCLVTAATVCGNDLFKTRNPTVARRCVLALGIFGALVSVCGKGILGFLLMAYDIFACGVVAPCFVGLMLLPGRRIQGNFACAAVISGGLLGLAAALTENSLYSYLGMGLSSLLALAGARKRAGIAACDFFGEPLLVETHGGRGPDVGNARPLLEESGKGHVSAGS